MMDQSTKKWRIPLWLITMLTSAYSGVVGAVPPPATNNVQLAGYVTQDSNMLDHMNAPGVTPFGIMTGHAGNWMFSYRYTFEKYQGNLDGTDHVSIEEILHNFAEAPTNMTMQMHMFSLMYALTDNFTLMAMLPYIQNEMDMLAKVHHEEHEEMPHELVLEKILEKSDGIGDLELRGTYLIYDSNNHVHRVFINGGIGFPTGSIDNRMHGEQLGYPMQVGSGTASLLPGVTYLGQALPWGWGAEFSSVIRLGRNDHDYRLGNRYNLSVWGARELTDWLSILAGANGEYWGNVHGADPLLDPMHDPTQNPNMQGGRSLNALLGINLHPRTRFFKDQRFLIQGDLPIVQSLDGPQLKRCYSVDVAWQWEIN